MKFIRDQHQLQKELGYSRKAMQDLYPAYFRDHTRKRILLVNPNINRFEALPSTYLLNPRN